MGQIVQGTVVECTAPMVVAQATPSGGDIIVAEQIMQQRQEQGRVRQLEGLLTISMQQHQIKMKELTQATHELKEQQKSMKGKSTQTVEQWSQQGEGKTAHWTSKEREPEQEDEGKKKRREIIGGRPGNNKGEEEPSQMSEITEEDVAPMEDEEKGGRNMRNTPRGQTKTQKGREEGMMKRGKPVTDAKEKQKKQENTI